MTDLPPDVTDALRRGEPLEAMKRLRAAAHLSLRDAKAAIDRATGQPPSAKPSLQEFFRTQAAKAARAVKAETPGGTLSRSSRTSAAPQPVARPDPLRVPRDGDLSPGEMPRRGSVWPLAVVVAAAFYAWLRLRGG